jgi:hypothetical protein
MRGDFLAVGDQIDDLHPAVREGAAEGPDAPACHLGKRALGYLVQHLQVAGIDRLLN